MIAPNKQPGEASVNPNHEGFVLDGWGHHLHLAFDESRGLLEGKLEPESAEQQVGSVVLNANFTVEWAIGSS